MCLHRPLTEKERGGDFSVRPPLGSERRDTPLGSGQSLLAGAPTDATELRARFLGPRRRPELFESLERGGDRLARSTFLPLAAADGAEREQRAGAPEGIGCLLVPPDSVFEERSGLGDGPARSGDEAAAARGARERSVVTGSSFGLPRFENAHGVV